MSDLIKDKNASGTGSFVVSCFTFYYFISRLGFISLLAFFFTPRHSENIQCLVIATFFVVYMFVIDKKDKISKIYKILPPHWQISEMAPMDLGAFFLEKKVALIKLF